MKVTINGEAADLTLEQERTVGDLLAGLAAWLDGSGYSVSGICIDGKRAGAENLALIYDQELSNIGELDIQASSWAELLREALSATLDALDEYGRAPYESKSLLGAAWLEGAAAAHLERKDPSLYAVLGKTFSGASIPEVEVRTVLTERIAELEHPLESLVELSAALEAAAAGLEELPLDLQTGKDLRAAESIGRFTATTEKLLRLIPILALAGRSMDDVMIEELPFKSFMDELAAALRELLAAYETKDAVLVGDLAEYELAPRLRALNTAVAALLGTAA